MYHGFTKGKDGLDDFDQLRIDEEDFRQHLHFLSKHYKVISLRDLVRSMSPHESLPERVAVITIDDGYAGVAEIAAPLLDEFGLPATVFLCTDFLGGRPLYHDRVEYAIGRCPAEKLTLSSESIEAVFQLDTEAARRSCYQFLMGHLKQTRQETRDSMIASIEEASGTRLTLSEDTPPEYRPMSWTQAQQLSSSSLIEIGNHTRSHAILTNCGHDEMVYEVESAHEEIEERLQTTCDLFCYPNGGPDDFNSDTRTVLEERAYCCALTTIQGPVVGTDDPLELNRYFARHDVYDLEASISGLIAAVKVTLGRINHGV